MLKTTMMFFLATVFFSCTDLVTNQDQVEQKSSQNQNLAKITTHDIFWGWDMDKWAKMKASDTWDWHDMDFMNKSGISSSYPSYKWELTVYEGSIPYTSTRETLDKVIMPYWDTYGGGVPLQVGDYANLTSYEIRYYNNNVLDNSLTLTGTIGASDSFCRDRFMFYESSIVSFSGPNSIDLSSTDYINVVAKIRLPDEFRATIKVNNIVYPYINQLVATNNENMLTYDYSYNISTDWIESTFLPWKIFPISIKIIIDSRMFNRIGDMANIYYINNSDNASITVTEGFE